MNSRKLSYEDLARRLCARIHGGTFAEQSTLDVANMRTALDLDDELEAAIAQQSQAQCKHGETEKHPIGGDYPDNVWCPGPQQAQPEMPTREMIVRAVHFYALNKEAAECIADMIIAMQQGCDVSPVSSRICQRGTKCCTVQHSQ